MILMSSNHRVLVDGKYKLVSELVPGDQIDKYTVLSVTEQPIGEIYEIITEEELKDSEESSLQ